MSFSLADSLSKTNISELIGSVVEEGDVYRDCSDFKIIKKERFATMFSAKKSIAKISNEDIALIKPEATTYRNANRKQLRRFGLIK